MSLQRVISLRSISRSGRRRGITSMILAVSLTVLLGMASLAVDYGLSVSDANALQRACDAAALGGVSQLVSSGTTSAAVAADSDKARSLALVLGRRNGVTVAQGGVTFPKFNQIRVQATSARRYLFAWALGLQGGSVTRAAVASKMPLKGITQAVPIAMTTSDYNIYKDGRSVEYNLINNHDTDFEDGKLASLDLRNDNSGKSGAIFQEDLTNGYYGTVLIGQDINNSLNADIQSQGKKLEDAMTTRFQEAAAASYGDTGNNYTYPNYPAESRRIMFLIVADPNLASNNNPTLNARFFVPVYVESVRSPAGKQLFLRFRIIPNYTFSSQNPGIVVGDDTTPFTGVTVTMLVQ